MHDLHTILNAFYDSDFENFAYILTSYRDGIDPSAIISLGVNSADPSKRCFFQALYRAGATIDVFDIRRYLLSTVKDYEDDEDNEDNESIDDSDSHIIKYDGNIFQDFLDHMHPKDQDSLKKLITNVLAYGTIDAITRMFRFIIQQKNAGNHVDTLNDILCQYCRMYGFDERFPVDRGPEYSPRDHIGILTNAGMDLASYPFLLLDALVYYTPGIPRALVEAGIPLSVAYDIPAYTEDGTYIDTINMEFRTENIPNTSAT